jgi:serine-type D-Ala-D-Ala carboxypeptidase/endopeptidase (penicillin-binding protein 4)
VTASVCRCSNRKVPPLRWAVAIAAILAGAACAPKTPPATAPSTAARPSPAVRQLQDDISRTLAAPAFDRMQWAVLVQTVGPGDTVFALQPAKLMMPASNMKLVTLAAAAERLGWDFAFETKLVTSAPVEGGVLRGDLVVVGSGDPTINGRSGAATSTFEAWADQLGAAGITRIDGRIVADARAFDREVLGSGWAWDYLAASYAAGVSALQFNEDVADVAIHPGPSPGTPAVVEVRPIESGLIPVNRVTTSISGSPDIDLYRLPGSNRLVVTGTVPVGSKETVRAAAVDRPALYFARMLRVTLAARGIEVTGDAGEYEDVYGTAPSDAAGGASRGDGGPPAGELRVLVSHRSPPLSEFARVMMKVSQNLYAETLLRTLGAQAGVGTAAAGRAAVREVLTAWGIEQDAYVQADGSGLSRYNYVCADTIVRILRRLYNDPRHREAFLATLPIGGQDGTIARRFIGMRAAGNVRAKTGSISNVRALSGFVTTLDGETLVFSVLANNFTVPQSTIDAATDAVVERLANFTRR